jgi:DNA-binding response OmpR family regulator
VNSRNIGQPRSNGSKAFRILMADPDESLRPVYREPLSREGFEVDRALSGLECISRLHERVPDVLVLEPQLPWGGGDGVLAMMGEDPDLAFIPVMVLTSCRSPHILMAVARFPVSDYQLKPLSPDRLVKKIRTLLMHPRWHFTLAEQTGRLECSIAQRTGGRVWDLRVEAVEGRIIVHGRSDSHHVKQLALAAVLEAFEASQTQSERVELDIDVVPVDNWQSQRCASRKTRNNNYSNEFDLTKES